MPEIFSFCPTGPSWRLEWDAIDRRFPWVRGLRGCPQNPRYHAEGDVWIHTRMVTEALVAFDAWRALETEDREDLFAAALLHDVGKPECTRVLPDGRVTSRGHARRGALKARRILWRLGVPLARRERICALVRHHMVPLYLRDSERRERQAVAVSHAVRCDHLGLLGRADMRGRISDDSVDLADRHDAFESICRRLGCLHEPYPFDSDHQRFWTFRRPEHPLGEPAPPLGESRVVLLSGLSPTVRRQWLDEHAGSRPVVDLDALSRRLGIGIAEDDSSEVVAEARGRARELLGRGASFVWNDACLTRELRAHLLDLFADHRARVEIVYLEPTEEQLLEEQRRHGEPPARLERMLDRWEVPDATEGHAVELRIDGAPAASAVGGLALAGDAGG